MGYELSAPDATGEALPRLPRLDRETDELLQDVVATLEQAFPDLLAIILFGSVPRHEERPLDDAETSDVDVLALFDTDDSACHSQSWARCLLGAMSLWRSARPTAGI